MRPAWIEVDLDALRHNTALLCRHVAPARLCAVVKAEGYGHGATQVAQAALEAGASMLAVAIVEEGVQLREAGITAPILILSEPPVDALDDVVASRLVPTLYRSASIRAADAAASRVGTSLDVHVKVDTGMRRVGADPADALRLVDEVTAADNLVLAGVFTHLAVADEPDNSFTDEQLHRFEDVLAAMEAADISPGLVHAANSAGAIRGLGAHSMVRCGISLYGLAPSPALVGAVGLEPVLSLHARVSYAKTVAAGEGVSYGLQYRPARDTRIVTVPLGYADGVRRILSERGAAVLIGGRRYPIVGTITMDQLLVDVGPDGTAQIGDEVVLLGRQGTQQIPVKDWADRLETITYEVVCGLTKRLPRIYRGAPPVVPT